MDKVVVTKEHIAEGLQKLGFQKGDIVFVHSSLSSFGYVKGGADAVIDALLETVGEEGTVMMPALTYSTVNARQPIFDVKHTPCVVGRIPETFRLRQEAKRSLHPTHSVAAIGAKAEYLTIGHEKDMTPCSRTSPYGKLVELGGYILFIGVDLRCNTTFHAMEEWANVPGRFGAIEQLHVIYENGNDILVPSKRHAGPSNDFLKMEAPLLEAGIMRIGKIGNATLRLVAAKPMAEMTMKTLEEDPEFFWKNHNL